MEEDEEVCLPTVRAATSTAKSDVKKEIVRKNVDKKARDFDFASIWATSIENAKGRCATATTKADCTFAESDVEESERDSMRSFGRNGVGVKLEVGDQQWPSSVKKVVAEDEDDEDGVGPALPPGFCVDRSVIASAGDYDDGFGDDDVEVKASSLIPAACEVTVPHSSKAVTAMAFDQQGSKFAVGGYSYSVSLYEFLKMDSQMKSFRDVEPCECHVINDLAFNQNGETLLVANGNCQLKLLDRQGKQWAETVRGDQYLVDLSNTKGHTAAVNACCWNPLNKTEFLTCADDGTLRIWSTDDFKVITKCINSQRKVIKTKNASGKRAIPTTCCYSADGKLIAAGCDDGSIQIWKNGKMFVNTIYLNRKAHNGPITSLQFSPDGKRILSRALDDTLKLFELRAFDKPLNEVTNLSNGYAKTDCGFSPHAEFIYTTTSSMSRDGQSGSLLFFDAETLELLYRIEYEKKACVRVRWHPKINQILVGLNDGTCRIYYDPSSSARGALLCAQRPVKRSRQSEVVREEIILSPLTLEMFQPRGEEGEEKEVTEWRIKKFLRMQNNSKRPQFRKPAEMPMTGPSAGGRLANSGGTLHSYIAKQLGTSKNKTIANDDVRASILRHAEEAEKDPLYVGKAYEKTQPTAIFQSNEEDDEEADGSKTTENDDEAERPPVFKVAKLG